MKSKNAQEVQEDGHNCVYSEDKMAQNSGQGAGENASISSVPNTSETLVLPR